MATYEDLVKQGYTGNYQKQIEEAMKNTPTYQSGHEAQLNDLYNRIMNREPFTYDMNGDALYQQYKSQYQTLGRQAMKDTMGQAAGLTGGYGSTYSQSVGQQAYNAYLQQLNNIVPDLYDRAYNRYNQQTQDLYNMYGLERDAENQDYSRHRDDVSDYWTNLSYLQSADEQEYSRYTNAENTAYSRQQDYYQRLVSLMTQAGYNPTDEDLAAAGMTRAQADAYRAYYAQQQAAASGGGGGGRSYGGGGYYGGGGSSSGSSNSNSYGANRDYSTQAASNANMDYAYNNQPQSTSGPSTYNSAYTQIKNKLNSDRSSLQLVESYDQKTGKWSYYSPKIGLSFTGTTKEEARKTAEVRTINSILSGMMSENAWNNNKKGFKTYADYLNYYFKFATT